MGNTGTPSQRSHMTWLLLTRLHRYHSHYRGQLDDGLRGPLLIHPSPSRAKPFTTLSSDKGELDQMAKAERNPKILQLSDWSQLTHDEIDADFRETGIEPL